MPYSRATWEECMKVLIAVLASLVASFSLAGDVLESPVSSASSTSATHQVTFTLGSLGFLQDVVLKSYCTNTGTVTLVSSTLGVTNTLGTLESTATSQARITGSYPVQRGDIIKVVYANSTALSTNQSQLSCWFKDVVR